MQPHTFVFEQNNLAGCVGFSHAGSHMFTCMGINAVAVVIRTGLQVYMHGWMDVGH